MILLMMRDETIKEIFLTYFYVKRARHNTLCLCRSMQERRHAKAQSETHIREFEKYMLERYIILKI